MMVLVYTLSIADRYVISTVLEPIRLELQLTDSGIAFLTGVALALFYVVLGFPISYLIDRGNRRNIIAVCLILWSAMTAFCGLSKNYMQLLIGRIGVGVGEAGGTPGANSIISDYFPAAKRPMALTIFSLGRADRRVARRRHRRHHQRRLQLAHRVPGAGHSRHRRRPADLLITIKEPRRGQLDHNGGDNEGASFGESMRFLWIAEVRGARDGGERAHGPLGLGPDVVDADVPDPQLRADTGRGGRHPRADPPDRRRPCDAAHRMVDVAAVDARPAAASCA